MRPQLRKYFLNKLIEILMWTHFIIRIIYIGNYDQIVVSNVFENSATKKSFQVLMNYVNLVSAEGPWKTYKSSIENFIYW